VTVNEVAKLTLGRMRRTKIEPTPENYAHIFASVVRRLKLKSFERGAALEVADDRLANLRLNAANAVIASACRELRALLTIVEEFADGRLSKEATFSLSRDLTHPLILRDDADRWENIARGDVQMNYNKPDIHSRTLGHIAYEFKQSLHQQEQSAKEIGEKSQRLLSGLRNKDAQATLLAFNKRLSEEVARIHSLQNRIEDLEGEIEKLRGISLEDFLTKSPNRRAIEKTLETLEEEYIANGENYAAIFFKIDQFGRLTREVGLESIEIVLNIMVRFMKANLPERARFGHYFGSFWLIATKSGMLDEIKRRTEALLELLASKKFVYKDITFSITASSGIGIRSEFASQRDMLNHAEKSMRAAEAAGGNRLLP
jgi:diguanylate cyclase (GGDEF)-like protein